MKPENCIFEFIQDESGAVTVDWVVLTAALVGLGLGVVTVISTSIGTTTDAIEADLAAAPDTGNTVATNAAGGTTP